MRVKWENRDVGEKNGDEDEVEERNGTGDEQMDEVVNLGEDEDESCYKAKRLNTDESEKKVVEYLVAEDDEEDCIDLAGGSLKDFEMEENGGAEKGVVEDGNGSLGNGGGSSRIDEGLECGVREVGGGVRFESVVGCAGGSSVVVKASVESRKSPASFCSEEGAGGEGIEEGSSGSVRGGIEKGEGGGGLENSEGVGEVRISDGDGAGGAGTSNQGGGVGNSGKGDCGEGAGAGLRGGRAESGKKRAVLGRKTIHLPS